MKPNNTNILYRVYDAAGELLYVGATLNPTLRFPDHAHKQPWWDDATTITLERFPNRHDLYAGEVAAIRDEKPRHNIVHLKEHPWAKGARGRKKGTGSIFQRADGAWMATLEFPQINGRRRTKKKYATSRDQALLNLELLKAERQNEIES